MSVEFSLVRNRAMLLRTEARIHLPGRIIDDEGGVPQQAGIDLKCERVWSGHHRFHVC